SHRPRWRSHQRGARRCRPQLQPAPALVRGAFTRPLVDPLPRPLGRPASPNRCRKTFFTADFIIKPGGSSTRRVFVCRDRVAITPAAELVLRRLSLHVVEHGGGGPAIDLEPVRLLIGAERRAR